VPDGRGAQPARTAAQDRNLDSAAGHRPGVPEHL
jgi:hypothetical protein